MGQCCAELSYIPFPSDVQQFPVLCPGPVLCWFLSWPCWAVLSIGRGEVRAPADSHVWLGLAPAKAGRGESVGTQRESATGRAGWGGHAAWGGL